MPASAQTTEVKEKPPMYSYVGFWAIPRAQWGAMAKSDEADRAVLDKALASGTIVAYGNDENLVHTVDGETHDGWWSSMSMAGLLNVLNTFYTNGSSTSPVLTSATKHWDQIFVSRYYNWHSGSWKGAYSEGGVYQLKRHAPDDAIDILSKNILVPFFEKQLADGNIHEYEIDTEAVHTQAPGMFLIVYLASSAEAVDKIHADLREYIKSNPPAAPAFDSMVDWKEHRDFLDLTNATYK
jgi:hypothetical protein